MPIIREPVLHRFGIVSHAEHMKLQHKLLKKFLKESTAKFSKHGHINPIELTEDFIQDFNHSINTEEEEEFMALAKKMLARCKRRSGLSTLGCGKHVELPTAWVEGIMLSQCNGEIQEEALEILIISMDHAPVVPDHAPVLFFIAESVLYKLCYDTMEQPNLFSCEVKLCKLGFLVFLRLLLLHISGYLEFSREHKDRLYIDLKALAACEICYQLYPNILFTVHFILKAGEAICEMAVLSESSLATDANLKELQPPVRTDTLVDLNSRQQQFKIKPFLWHSLLLWVCVHNSCSETDEVLKHVLFYKEQLLQKDWLESALGLMVLGETAKLNVSCLKVLMDLVRDFISSSVSLQKQQKNNKESFSCWIWQVGYIYTNILREICLNAIDADLQKTAFLGFCDCAAQDGKELTGASFLDLLHYRPSSDECVDPFWIIRYGVIYNLVILLEELSGDVNREGLRNAVWRSLQEQKLYEKEKKVLDAVILAEVETKGPVNPFLAARKKVLPNPRDFISSQYIGWRVTTSLSHHFLPPIGPHIPLPHQPLKKPPSMPYQESKPYDQKKASRLSLREELLQAGVPKYPYPDILTRTDMELRRIIDDQWQKELQIRLKLEEKIQQLEQKKKQKKEEEHFRKIMKWRLENLHKTTKPYELTVPHEDEEGTEPSGSTEPSTLDSLEQLSQT